MIREPAMQNSQKLSPELTRVNSPRLPAPSATIGFLCWTTPEKNSPPRAGQNHCRQRSNKAVLKAFGFSKILYFVQRNSEQSPT
jgi:hypothetical protein